jgi:hypothetical protein
MHQDQPFAHGHGLGASLIEHTFKTTDVLSDTKILLYAL